MPLVAGVDSSTQSCKVTVRDATTGALVRVGAAAHPDGTEVAPVAWWSALGEAVRRAGGLHDVSALSVAGQQHGMVCLDTHGASIRPALLWNDTRSAAAATDLVEELGNGEPGGRAWARAVGVVPVAAITVAKLRWLAEHEPTNAQRTHAVCLPHDWLTWRLSGSGDPATLTTDRGDASGTGYWSAATGQYRMDLLRLALGQDAVVPRVLGPYDDAGRTERGVLLGAGTGDNAAAALGVGAASGDVIMSIGTSGVVSAVADVPAADPTGAVAGFADATGHYLPLVCTLNAARVLDAAARMLSVDHDALSRLALAAPPGADGLVLVPYLEGERTPNRPDATGALHGLRLQTADAAHIARATVEGLLCGLADGLDALRGQGARVERIILVGGGARSAALRQIAPTVLGCPVTVPATDEYVARGAARQAAWALAGGEDPPRWAPLVSELFDGTPEPAIRARYAQVRELTAPRPR